MPNSLSFYPNNSSSVPFSFKHSRHAGLHFLPLPGYVISHYTQQILPCEVSHMQPSLSFTTLASAHNTGCFVQQPSYRTLPILLSFIVSRIISLDLNLMPGTELSALETMMDKTDTLSILPKFPIAYVFTCYTTERLIFLKCHSFHPFKNLLQLLVVQRKQFKILSLIFSFLQIHLPLLT